MDGRELAVPAGTQLRLRPRESISITPFLYHDFEVEDGISPVLLGEGSQCNDDNTDNRFYEKVGRFPAIEADEPPYRLLCFKVAAFYFAWTFGCAIVAGLTIGRSKVKNQVKTIEEIMAQKAKKATSCSAKSKKNTGCCGTQPKQATVCCAGPVLEAASCCGETISPTSSTDCCSASVTSGCGQPEPTPSSGCCAAAVCESGSHAEKAKNALAFGWILFKRIISYVLLGAAISGFAVAYVPNEIVEKYVGNGSWYAIPLAAAIGVPLYLRIEMAIPLLSVLLTKGMSMGAAMSLLIGGTGASAPELAILSSMLKPKGLLVFVLTIFIIATAGGFLFMLI